MKRKIAAIFAADVAGYSRLVAEDEEETLRRLASYREVTDEFIAKAGGRIFNTAGDAVLAEFPSAVEAVRCAIDIQESLRTRNMAYPPSRQMSFRIGITIGDVVERDGDLLGDGVNIAARLEGLAEVGGICVSRAVHEQVANKLSVQFADIGAQEVKNIPNPVHAYMVAMRQEDGSYATPRVNKPQPKPAAPAAANWMWPAVALVIALASIGAVAFLSVERLQPAKIEAAAVPPAAQPAFPPPEPAATPSPMPAAPPPEKAAATPSPPPASPPPIGERFAVDTVPFISERERANLASNYAPGPGHKALAIDTLGTQGFVTGRPSDEEAKRAALDMCQARLEHAGETARHCEVYAVGDAVVYARGRPLLPPQPWFRRDPTTARPFASHDLPLVREAQKGKLETTFGQAKKPRVLAIGPSGQAIYNGNAETLEGAARRSLETCGTIASAACMIVAVDDDFVVPIPATMRATGFFYPAADPAIAAEGRAELARRLSEASDGWSAVAVGAQNHPGLGLKAATEQKAIDGALADCARRDTGCHVIAIGPFTVAP